VTDIERMIWAETFARCRAEYNCDVTESGRRADKYVADFRGSRWAEELGAGGDVEAALVDALSLYKHALVDDVHAEVVKRLGRPLRGAK